MTVLPPTGLADRIRLGETRSLEAVDAYLERIERIDGRLNAYITVAADRARQRAREADEAL